MNLIKLIAKFWLIVKGYFLYLIYHIYEPYRLERENIAKERMDICRQCMYLKNGRCQLCGCFMKIKTKMHLEEDEKCLDKR